MSEDGHARRYAIEALNFKMSMQGHGHSETFMLHLANAMRSEIENGRPENALANMREHYLGIHITEDTMYRYIEGILK